MAKEKEKQRGYNLHEIPEDVTDIIRDKQYEVEKRCHCTVSKATIIYKLIRLAKDLPLYID